MFMPLKKKWDFRLFNQTMATTYYRRHSHQKASRSHFGPFLILVISLLVILSFFYFVFKTWHSYQLSQRDEGVLSVEAGTVEIQEWGQDAFVATASSQVFLTGDRLRTAEGSYARLHFGQHSEFFLDENSELSFYETADTDSGHELHFELVRGRVAYAFEPSVTDPVFSRFRLGLMELLPLKGSGVLSLGSEVLEARVTQGEAMATYWDRGESDVKVDEQWISSGERSRLTPAIQTAFLNREDVSLVESIPSDEPVADNFLSWVQGGSVQNSPMISNDPVLAEEASADSHEEESLEEDEKVALPTDTLALTLDSPQSPFSLTGKTGVAIEGHVRAGTAERITVQWSGGGAPYALSMFEPGSSNFRFVADVAYGNLTLGENRYTIIAYDADGTASSPVTVVVNYK